MSPCWGCMGIETISSRWKPGVSSLRRPEAISCSIRYAAPGTMTLTRWAVRTISTNCAALSKDWTNGLHANEHVILGLKEKDIRIASHIEAVLLPYTS